MAEAFVELRELTLGGVRERRTPIDLSDLGFVGYVSAEARAEIEAHDRRAALVLTTSHLYRFKGRG